MSFEESASRLVVSALGKAPVRLQRLIGGAPTDRQGRALHPEVAAALRLLNAMPDSDFSDLPVDESRRTIDAEAALFGGPPLPLAEVRDLEIPTSYGSLPARRYRAEHRDADRLLVYFHGGGWVLGSLDSADSACRFLAKHSGVSVLSIDYRLAPEHPFPAATQDARTAFDYAVAKAGEWGHRADRIAVGGDSAGGNLAAVL